MPVIDAFTHACPGGAHPLDRSVALTGTLAVSKACLVAKRRFGLAYSGPLQPRSIDHHPQSRKPGGGGAPRLRKALNAVMTAGREPVVFLTGEPPATLMADPQGSRIGCDRHKTRRPSLAAPAHREE